MFRGARDPHAIGRALRLALGNVVVAQVERVPTAAASPAPADALQALVANKAGHAVSPEPLVASAEESNANAPHAVRFSKEHNGGLDRPGEGGVSRRRPAIAGPSWRTERTSGAGPSSPPGGSPALAEATILSRAAQTQMAAPPLGPKQRASALPVLHQPSSKDGTVHPQRPTIGRAQKLRPQCSTRNQRGAALRVSRSLRGGSQRTWSRSLASLPVAPPPYPEPTNGTTQRAEFEG